MINCLQECVGEKLKAKKERKVKAKPKNNQDQETLPYDSDAAFASAAAEATGSIPTLQPPDSLPEVIKELQLDPPLQFRLVESHVLNRFMMIQVC